MPDMMGLLNMKASEIKEMPVMPAGEYLARVGQHKLEMQKTKNGERPVLRISFTVLQAINIQGEMPPRIPEMNHTFWLTNDDGQQDEYTLEPLKRFLDATGVEQGDKGIAELLPEVINSQVTLTIVHTPNPNSQTGRPYVNIRGFGKP